MIQKNNIDTISSIDTHYTWLDYERNIMKMVNDYNETAFCLGAPILGFTGDESLSKIILLSLLNIETCKHSILKDKMERIKMWAKLRLKCKNANIQDETIDRQIDEHWENAQELKEKGHVDAAISEYEKAASLGHPWGYETLGEIFRKGYDGICQDYKKAAFYYKKGADAGSWECMSWLGDLYHEGKGVSQDDKQAYFYHREGALLNRGGGGYSLARDFENGWGCEKDLCKALFWYDMGAVNDENGDRIRRLLTRMGKAPNPIRVDGYNYNNYYFTEETMWWQDYYKSHDMIRVEVPE